MLALLLGCAPEDVRGDDTCAEGPRVTWESDGEAIVTQWCQPCHASSAPDRHDAPAGVTFDTREDVLAWKSEILLVTDPEAPAMPPGMPLPEDDRARLEAWLRCEE